MSNEFLVARVTNDFTYHKPTPEKAAIHDAVSARFFDIAMWLVGSVPPGREQSLALTSLQEARMWANAAVACNQLPDKAN